MGCSRPGVSSSATACLHTDGGVKIFHEFLPPPIPKQVEAYLRGVFADTPLGADVGGSPHSSLLCGLRTCDPALSDPCPHVRQSPSMQSFWLG